MNICRLRTARHWTQEGLAESAGLDVRHLQRIEAGKPDPGFLVLHKLCEALECDWNTMTEGLSEPSTLTEKAALGNIPA